MINVMCSVYDKIAQDYSRPFYAINKADAMRSFAELANDKSTKVGKTPADFQLFHVANFDNLSGEISVINSVLLATASDFVLEQ